MMEGESIQCDIKAKKNVEDWTIVVRVVYLGGKNIKKCICLLSHSGGKREAMIVMGHMEESLGGWESTVSWFRWLL